MTHTESCRPLSDYCIVEEGVGHGINAFLPNLFNQKSGIQVNTYIGSNGVREENNARKTLVHQEVEI